MERAIIMVEYMEFILINESYDIFCFVSWPTHLSIYFSKNNPSEKIKFWDACMMPEFPLMKYWCKVIINVSYSFLFLKKGKPLEILMWRKSWKKDPLPVWLKSTWYISISSEMTSTLHGVALRKRYLLRLVMRCEKNSNANKIHRQMAQANSIENTELGTITFERKCLKLEALYNK